MRQGASLRGRLVSAMALLLTLVLALALVSATAMSRVDRTSAAAINRLVEGDSLTSALTVAITRQVRLAELRIRSADDAGASALQQLADSTHALQRLLRLMPGQGPDAHAQLNRIADAQATMEVAQAQARTWRLLDRPTEALRTEEVATADAEQLLAEVRTLASLQAADAQARAAALDAQARRLRTLVWVLVFVVLGIGISSAWFTVRSVDRPLARLVAATRRFGAGDLRPTDLTGMPAELAALGGAMNGMGARIRHLLTGVAQEAAEVGSGANDFSAMSQELAATSGQVSDAMVHLTQAADGQVLALRDADLRLGALRDAGTATLRAARRVTAIAAGIGTMATDHRDHILAASTTLLALRETVRASAARMREVVRQADQLGELAERDRRLADKLGVLAVNSAIEAARAGAQGQGITAVAEELRLLGERSEAAATDEEAAIATLQAQIRATASTLDAGTTTVLGVEGIAARAATALAEILRATEQVHRAAAQVEAEAEAAGAGLHAMLERTTAVARAAADHAVTGESVSAAAEEQAAATEEMASAAARLSDAADRLTALLGEFRT